MTDKKLKTFNLKLNKMKTPLVMLILRSVLCAASLETHLSSPSLNDFPLLRSVRDNVSWSEFQNLKKVTTTAAVDIYSAHWNGKLIIIKSLKNESNSTSRAGSTKEMEHEIGILQRLDHPNIVRILGSGYHPFRFSVLEYLEGGTISKLLNYTYRDSNNYGKDKLPLDKVFRIAISTASALCYIHEEWQQHARLFHRDLKTDNVGMAADGTVKVFDFGLSKLITKIDRNQEDLGFHLSTEVGSWRYY